MAQRSEDGVGKTRECPGASSAQKRTWDYAPRACSLLPSIIERMRAAMLSIANGLVSTAIPGGSVPLLRIAFSA